MLSGAHHRDVLVAGANLTLLNFTAIDATSPYFWLRSAGSEYYSAGVVGYGSFSGSALLFGDMPVRPALAIQLD